ncbi:hydrogenase formation protein HypD [Anoxybacter fermentans]|uniref:Hydrogenase formation protein HypD n=1 Tax=Anoxybacter fermentans TaxID=1323375 RepID=A0A3S9SXF8_9FIRM|nr:hydrogenase formation protein HypD [Anoxybacter fermentans]AZR72940.1 hydrogenase formation protein HypD [Anoxybacter fermentans]
MKNRYRDPLLIQKVTQKIHQVTESLDRTVRLMEVCGTHTHSIFHFGIRDLLPEKVELISGPGCPVCVTPMEFIDQAILLSRQPDVIITTFGDLMRVPGKRGSLLQAKAEGADVEILYSPLDSLKLARENPEKLVVFLGVGFETTIPLSALAIQQAEVEGIRNFKILNAHKIVPPALRALTTQDIRLDGFILPGHVSAIIGLKPYHFLAEEFGMPGVVAGFEPLEILLGILKILEQLSEGRAEIENVYRRVVCSEGNRRAVEMINKYFVLTESEWRGLGMIPDSGLMLKDEWKDFDLLTQENLDAVKAVQEEMEQLSEYSSQNMDGPCICGLILTGRKIPLDCPSFDKVCTPESPLGACMVSAEGTCAAYYRYRGRGGRFHVR